MLIMADGKVHMPHFTVVVMHLAQWEVLVGMEICTAQGMVQTLLHLALPCSTMGSVAGRATN